MPTMVVNLIVAAAVVVVECHYLVVLVPASDRVVVDPDVVVAYRVQ